ncbi:MAG: exodeoxyribonuclease VII large subunit [Lachnospiraceae bacterium]|nr:exodeoxyribonuclease VII large subunit [Lachnospiraceae bacterium]
MTQVLDKVYSVSRVNAYLKEIISEDYSLKNISVKGEISNCKYHSSGHIYFTLKDELASMQAVMFQSMRHGLAFHMKDGDRVVVRGSVELYERDGRCQLYARKVELDGTGALYLKFEQLKAELEEMGMFDPSYKKPIPKFADKIGIVTAPTGAAVRDIINIATRRNPGVQLILYPALVQGEGAAESVAGGLAALDAYGVDVIICGRGGGSIEDLWAFNEEIVAQAIFRCNTPVISAVGHETDTTIADFVSDLRAPTPSAAAELAVWDKAAALDAADNLKEQLLSAMKANILNKRATASDLLLKMEAYSPKSRINSMRLYSDSIYNNLIAAMKNSIFRERKRLEVLATSLDALSPLKRLKAGYSLVTNEEGKVVTELKEIKSGDNLTLNMLEGSVKTEVKEVIWRT